MANRFEKYDDALDVMYDGDVPEYIRGAGKTFIKIAYSGILDEQSVVTVRVEDVIHYYAHDARNITSGCRSLAGIHGDWRPVDNLAKACLEYFKRVNRPALEREGKKFGMTLR